MTPLSRAEAVARVDALCSGTALTELQAARLRAIVRVLGADGRFLLRAALDAAEFPVDQTGGQDAFQDFRRRVNDAASASGIDVRLDLESRKSPPEGRSGWFAGGDLTDAGIAAFTEKGADDTGIAHPIAPEVAELGDSRVTRVYVSVAEVDSAKSSTRQLIDRLDQYLKLDSERRWEITGPGSTRLGEDLEETRERFCAQADVRVVLLSPSYLADTANAPERDRVLGRPGRRVVIALTSLPDAAASFGPMPRHEVLRCTQPWTNQRGERRQQYLDDLVFALRREISVVSAPAPVRDGTADLIEHTKRLAGRRGGNDSAVLVDSEVSETTFREAGLEAPQRGPALAAVARLLEWAAGTTGPRLCALLGDVGLGKTTTAKLFARALLDQRANGAPLPLLFDLRDVRATDLARTVTLDGILDSMLEANRPAEVPRERLSAETVRRRLTAGDAVVIFDGLDEALVHLTPHDQRLFIRQLWRAVEGTTGSRMLLTCRTQYFRTIRDEVNFFTGDDRPGPEGKDYLALLMLPFGPQQIRDYLAANLGAPPEKVEEFLTVIGGVHDLTDLASRPMTLKLISEQVEFIETAKLQGRELLAVDLYGEVVERWLARDSGKHNLLPDHKRLLMEAIAAEIWRSGRNSWTANDVDEWLLELLERRPDLRRHYRQNVPDLWKTDFRTATFLSRDGDEFAFGHRSLFEYFLARHLFRALRDVPTAGVSPVAMPVPSSETLDFLGQCLTAATVDTREAALAGLAAIRDHYTPEASELAFAYALRAAGRGHPHQRLSGVQLPGARLSGWTIGAPEADGYALSLAGANFRGTDLHRARIYHADLTGADLTEARLDTAEIHDSQLNHAMFDRALIATAVLRHCGIEGVDFSRTIRHRTQLLWCTPGCEPTQGILRAPLPREEQVMLSGNAAPWVTGGHIGGVSSVAWSPEGARLVTGSSDSTVRVWDVVTGAEHLNLTGHVGGVNSVAWSPDGTRLATASSDHTVRVWDVATGAEHLNLTGHTDWVRSVAWSTDGTRLATGGDDKTVRVWDVATGTEISNLTGHGSWVRSVAWSPDGARLATGGDDKTVRVWDVATGAEMPDPTGHVGVVSSVAWSPDGARLATSSNDRTVRVWDVATGAEHVSLTGHAGVVSSVAWSPDGARLATSSNDRTVRVWDVATGAEHANLTGHDDVVNAVAWSPDGARLATGGDDSTVRVWDVATGAEYLNVPGHDSWVRSVAWSPDGARLATGGNDSTVRVWDVATGAEHLKVTGHAGGVSSVAWSPDGARLATGGEDSTVRVWDVAAGAEHVNLTGRNSSNRRVNAVAWSPDGARLAATSDSAVRVWDVATGADHLNLTSHVGGVRSVAWSPDGARLATASSDTTVRVWDVATGADLLNLTGHVGAVNSVAWSPDGARLATASSDTTVRVWDVATGAELLNLTGHTDWVHSVAWSPDGAQLATGSDDSTVRIWSSESSQNHKLVVYLLGGSQAAIFHGTTGQLAGATAEAWRWIFWSPVDTGSGWPDGLPAEIFGPLPPLPTPRNHRV